MFSDHSTATSSSRVAKFSSVDDGAVDRQDERLLAELRNVLQDAPQVGQFHGSMTPSVTSPRRVDTLVGELLPFRLSVKSGRDERDAVHRLYAMGDVDRFTNPTELAGHHRRVQPPRYTEERIGAEAAEHGQVCAGRAAD